MKSLNILSILLLIFFEANAQSVSKYALVLHGGAGVMSAQSMTPDMQSAYTLALNRALFVGDSVLSSGGTCMDAVMKTIMVLEILPFQILKNPQ